MTIPEAIIKMPMIIIFVPIPTAGLPLLGLWLDYYKLNTAPLFLILGALIGAALGFLGVIKIISYGHAAPAETAPLKKSLGN